MQGVYMDKKPNKIHKNLIPMEVYFLAFELSELERK